MPRQLSLEWWDPLPDTPENVTAKSIRNAGWIFVR
jgi:hypothetical protein